MGRLTDLGEELTMLQRDASLLDVSKSTELELLGINGLMLFINLAFEQVTQLTRIANSMELPCVTPHGPFIAELANKHEKLRQEFDELQALVDQTLLGAEKRIAKDVARLDEEETPPGDWGRPLKDPVEIPPLDHFLNLEEEEEKDGPDVLKSPYYDPLID